MKAIEKSMRLAVAGVTASLLGGCGALPIHATFDNLTNETVTRASDFFDYTSLISISGLTPQHGAQLMFHQPTFYDGKPGSPSYAVGVSPWKSFIVEMKFPMGVAACSAPKPPPPADTHCCASSAKDQKAPPDEKTAETKALVADGKCKGPADVVRDIRNGLEEVRDLVVIQTSRRVEQELADALTAKLAFRKTGGAKLAVSLTDALGDGKSAAEAATNLAKLSPEKRAELRGKLKTFAEQCGAPAANAAPAGSAATPAATPQAPLPAAVSANCANINAGIVDKMKKLADSLADGSTPDTQTALDLKKALGKTPLADDGQVALAKGLLGDDAVDADNNVDYGNLAVKGQAAKAEIVQLETKINEKLKTLRDQSTYSNVLITRWAREKRNTLSGAFSNVFGAGKQSHETTSGILIMGDLRTTTLFTGEDLVDLIQYSKGRYLEFLDKIGITTYSVQAKHIAYSADRDAESAIAGNFNLSPDKLRAMSKIFDNADLKVNFALARGLDLGNSALISASEIASKTSLFFPPDVFESAVRQEIRDSYGYQTVFAVRAKIKTPFIEHAMRMETDLFDKARKEFKNTGLEPCEQRALAHQRIVAGVAALNDEKCCPSGAAIADSAECRQKAQTASLSCLMDSVCAKSRSEQPQPSNR